MSPRAPLSLPWSLLLLCLLVLVAAVCAAPSAPDQALSEPSPAAPRASPAAPRASPAGLQYSPALRVRLSDPPAAYQCTDGACYSLCILLGWSGGFCLDADWCLCYS